MQQIIEKYVHKQLADFHYQNSIVCATQSGFRPGHGCMGLKVIASALAKKNARCSNQTVSFFRLSLSAVVCLMDPSWTYPVFNLYKSVINSGSRLIHSPLCSQPNALHVQPIPRGSSSITSTEF
ncbi:hypothetical protein ATANTOWER_019336 [Ataeniobius toweri]|uniref:Reverse transcriptase domain-containing protein n=1 Tax=Ataeniobius toweri TaxID=208326 RepID=A0ABU7BHI8_9TELE|nr:hypothetical protein [Ataeniobius toweri]